MGSGLCTYIRSLLLLQIKMADEHSTLNEVKRQQLKVLDDQQKVYADDLSK